jgi:hypothetical protein
MNVHSSAAVIFSKTEYETKGINEQGERKTTAPATPAHIKKAGMPKRAHKVA